MPLKLISFTKIKLTNFFLQATVATASCAYSTETAGCYGDVVATRQPLSVAKQAVYVA